MIKKGTKLKLKNRYGTPYQTEDWNDPKYLDDPDIKPEIFRQPPKKYETNFLAKMDKRSQAYQLLKESFDEITADRGGVEQLSHVQLCLIEKFCFMEFLLRKKELEMAESNKNGKRDKNFGSYVQWLNCMIGLSKVVGLERQAKKITSLQSYINKNAQKSKMKRKTKTRKE